MKLWKKLLSCLILVPCFSYANNAAIANQVQTNETVKYNIDNYKKFFVNYSLVNGSAKLTGIVLKPKRASLHPGDSIYARLTEANPQPGSYVVFNQLDSYYATDEKTILGQGLSPIAKVSYINTPSENVAQFKITALYQDIPNDAKIIASNQLLSYPAFTPYHPSESICGKIVASVPHAAIISRFQTMIINLGTADGLHAGALLPIVLAPTATEDPTDKVKLIVLPTETIGMAMVYSLSTHISLALVIEAQQEISLANLVCNVE